MSGYDAIVVGGGIVGASCFRALAESGLRCLLIEEKRAGLGATGYSGAMVRVAHAHERQIAHAAKGFHAFRGLERESGGRVGLRRCGHLYFGQPDQLRPKLAAVRAHGCRAELLDGDALAARFPGMGLRAEAAIHEPEAGCADPVAFTRHQIERGADAGGTAAEGVRVERLETAGSRVTGVVTSAGRFAADKVVLATGGGTPGMLARHGLGDAGLWAQMIQVTLFERPGGRLTGPAFVDDDLDLNGLPCRASGRYYLGLPTHLRLGEQVGHGVGDPDHAERTRRAATTRLDTLADARAVGVLAHADSYTRSIDPVLGPLADGPEGLLLAAGFSGGGFKMATHAAERIREFAAARSADTALETAEATA